MGKTILALGAMAAMAAVLGGCAGFVRERIYRPDPIVAAPQWAGEAPQETSVVTADGLRLSGWYWPPARGEGEILVFFHGNGGNRDTAAARAEPLRSGGRGLLIADYRGYSGNPGNPSERGLIMDGEAFLDHARRLHPKAKIYLFGWSMGGAVALQLAARHRVDGVVTLGTFARLADVAPAFTRPFLPDRFDNLALIARVQAPVFLFHGTEDRIVPFEHAAQLERASGGGARVVAVRGAGHHFDFSTIAGAVWNVLHGNAPTP